MVFSVEVGINGICTMGGTTCVHAVLGNLVQGSTSPSPNDFFLGVGDAILLTISMKYMFLMKGDTVYAGVCGLNNHIQTSGNGNGCVGNGALCLHFYLSPSGSRFDGSVVSTKSADNNIHTQVQVNRDTSKESMVKYLVQCDGSR